MAADRTGEMVFSAKRVDKATRGGRAGGKEGSRVGKGKGETRGGEKRGAGREKRGEEIQSQTWGHLSLPGQGEEKPVRGPRRTQ